MDESRRTIKKHNFVENVCWMKLVKNKYWLLFYIVLFSVLGCFSYSFLLDFTGVPSNRKWTVSSFMAIFISVFVFNVIGLSLVYINERMGRQVISYWQNKKRVFLGLLAVGFLLFMLNYLMLVSMKLIAGLPEPFMLKAPVLRILLIIWIVELIIVGLIITNNFYRNLITLYRKTLELEESAAKSKYQALQNQLNPHFLFNSLNTLVSEIEYNPRNAGLFTRHLSDVYRYILQSNDQQTVSLQSELDFLDSYLFLHKVRLGDCIFLENRMTQNYIEMKVPPLTLQLLIENVIKHNVISLTKPITIRLEIDEKGMMLEVKNEIRKKKNIAPSGKGLQNLLSRYVLLCNKKIVIENDEQNFIVKVPLLYE